MLVFFLTSNMSKWCAFSLCIPVPVSFPGYPIVADPADASDSLAKMP